MLMFRNSVLERDYGYWCAELAGAPRMRDGVLSLFDVITAHYLLAEFFADEAQGMGGIGPRDSDAGLLSSTVSRQTIEYFGATKWNNEFETAATLMFGVIKNHPFRDGNKRTGLLATLCLLERLGRRSSASPKNWEDLVVDIAAGSHRNSAEYATIEREFGAPEDDIDIYYLAHRLKVMTVVGERTTRPLTYRHLDRLLGVHDYALHEVRSHEIGVYSIPHNNLLGTLPIYSMNDKVNSVQLRKIRELCPDVAERRLSEDKFYQNVNLMEFIIAEYRQTFLNLAFR